jgi:hypothetical protein
MPDSRRVQAAASIVLSTPLGEGASKHSFGFCAVRTVARAKVVCSRFRSPTDWRCIAVENVSAVELLKGSWRTAPNHSRPASCIVDADIDAEDYPERDPQKGH